MMARDRGTPAARVFVCVALSRRIDAYSFRLILSIFESGARDGFVFGATVFAGCNETQKTGHHPRAPLENHKSDLFPVREGHRLETYGPTQHTTRVISHAFRCH